MFDAGTGTGIPSVKVHLKSWSTLHKSTTSDGTGLFRFGDVDPGEYRIYYDSPDYYDAEGGTVSVPADRTLNLEAPLMALSTISGRVVDPDGRPMAYAQLELRSQGFTFGGRVYHRTSWGEAGGASLTESPMQHLMQGKADASGNFVLKVTPGAYSLSAFASTQAPPPTRVADDPLLAWRRGNPLRLAISSGMVVAGIKLQVDAVPAFSVRGEVRSADGSPAANAVLALEDSVYGIFTKSKADGTFELTAVPRGTWCLKAEAAKARALDCFVVGQQDVEGFRLDLAVPMTLNVRLQTEGLADKAAPSLGPQVLKMPSTPERPLDDTNRHAAVVVRSADGKYAALDAYPGRYRFAGGGRPPSAPFYLSAVLAGEQDLLRGDGLVLPGQTLTLVLRSDSGSLKGQVEHCASGSVLLIPADTDRRGRGWSRSGPCGATGDYELAGVAPGEYALLALAGGSPVPSFDEALLQQGTRVTVRSGETSTVDLRVAYAPVY